MERKTSIKHFGLIGKRLDYSFSKKYFESKFKALELENTYTNYEFETETELADFMLEDVWKLSGFNITIPYKETIIPYLDKLDKTAVETQAVNTVVVKNGILIGYNTDVHGFSKSINPLITTQKKALILGTGGASKAVAVAFSHLNIPYQLVSRNPVDNTVISYQDINESILNEHLIIVNTTPLGTFPKTDEAPDIPYQYCTEQHLFFDLVYNPIETKFMKLGMKHNAVTKNGLDMLRFQADKAWSIWNM